MNASSATAYTKLGGVIVAVLAALSLGTIESQDFLHGTVGVVYYTPTKIIMAADSRLSHSEGALPPIDTGCKISAVGGELLFVSSGLTARVPEAQTPGWDNASVLREVYQRVKIERPRDFNLASIAWAWSQEIAERFNNENRLHPGFFPWVSARVLRAGESLTIGYLGGRGRDGNLVLFLVFAGLNSAGTTAEGDAKPISACEDHGFCSVGAAVEKIKEFANFSSDAAKDEWGRWKAPKGASPESHDALKTIRMVEIGIRDYPDDSGGPIDAVQLNRDGSVRWYAKKQNCPER